MIKDEEEHMELNVVRKINKETTNRDAVENKADCTYNEKAWAANNGKQNSYNNIVFLLW